MAVPDKPETFSSAFPHRIRTLDMTAFQFTATGLASGDQQSVFETVRTAEAQPFECAYAEVTVADVQLEKPPAITSLTPADLAALGSILLGGAVDEAAEVEVRITGENEISAPVWLARDAGATTLEEAAASLADWLNGDPTFSSYFSASAQGTTVSLTDLVGIGGTVLASTAGQITATASGMASGLGILIGRKYAVAFVGGGYRSALSPLSPSIGPTGAAARIEIQGVPIPGDERVEEVWVYATPDGQDEPFYRVATVAAGIEYAVDTTPEESLQGQPGYPGPYQPALAGDVLVTLNRNGEPWVRLFVPAAEAKSNVVHGFALDPLEEARGRGVVLHRRRRQGHLRPLDRHPRRQ